MEEPGEQETEGVKGEEALGEKEEPGKARVRGAGVKAGELKSIVTKPEEVEDLVGEEGNTEEPKGAAMVISKKKDRLVEPEGRESERLQREVG